MFVRLNFLLYPVVSDNSFDDFDSILGEVFIKNPNMHIVIDNWKDHDLIKIKAQIKKNNMKSQQKYKEYFDRSRKNALVYKTGDLVMLKNVVTEAGINHKLLPKFTGPYIVTNVLGNDRYIVEDVSGNQFTNKKFKGTALVPHLI